MTLFAAVVYFGWLWNNRGAGDYRQLLTSIRFPERVKRRRTLKRRVMKKLGRGPKISPRFNPSHPVVQELEATP